MNFQERWAISDLAINAARYFDNPSAKTPFQKGWRLKAEQLAAKIDETCSELEKKIRGENHSLYPDYHLNNPFFSIIKDYTTDMDAKNKLLAISKLYRSFLENSSAMAMKDCKRVVNICAQIYYSSQSNESSMLRLAA